MSAPWPPPQVPAPLPPVAGPPGSPPRVLLWQKVYCWVMAGVYLLCTALGFGFVLFREKLADENASATENLLVGILLVAVALPLAAAYAAGPLLPRRPWAWVYHVTLIALSLTSCACVPFAVPLLVLWIAPEVQAWFGRRTAVAGPPPPPPPALHGAPA